ncbi:MAG: diguanylate cyclase [Frankiales bacterium]|nr:MAG: diguanylate cyclase [Frankiales bacterium]
MQAGEQQALHETIVQHVTDIITVVSPDGIVRFVNRAGQEAAEAAESREAEGSESVSWVHPEDRELTLERRQHLLGGPGRTTTTVLRVRTRDGWRHVETHGVNLVDDPHVRGLLYITRDVEDRARAETLLVRALAAQNVVADLGLRALRSSDVDSVVRDGLAGVAAVLGTTWVTLLLEDRGVLRVHLQVGPDPLPPGRTWTAGAVTQAAVTLATRHATVSDDLDADQRFAVSPEQASQGVRAEVDVPLEGSTGPLGVLMAGTTELRSFGPSDVQFLQGVANVLAGALEREKRERSALVRALHDPLTGLPTRSLFTDRLEHALSRARRHGHPLAVLLVDLDGFKRVNDRWGHGAGDAVLRAMGPRLAACARASDTVARYGGDEFVVLCEDEVTHVGVVRVAATIRRACAEPVLLPDGTSVMVSASIGIAWSVEEGVDADALLSAADAAMYRDKRQGRPD